MGLQEEVISIIGETSEKDEGGDFGFGINIGGIELFVSTNDPEVRDIGETHFQLFLSDSALGAKITVALPSDQQGPDALLKYRKLMTRTVGEVEYCARWDFCGTINLKNNFAWFLLSEPQPQSLDTIVRIYYALLAPRHDGLLLHASSVAWDNEGYCFVGPSGRGKSTIIKLVDEATVLSDETTLVRVVNGKSQVSGTPFHGEVPKFTNLTVPLRGIFQLQKSRVTRSEPLSVEDAINTLLRNTMFFGHNLGLKKRLLGNTARLVNLTGMERLQFQKNRKFWEIITNGS